MYPPNHFGMLFKNSSVFLKDLTTGQLQQSLQQDLNRGWPDLKVYMVLSGINDS